MHSFAYLGVHRNTKLEAIIYTESTYRGKKKKIDKLTIKNEIKVKQNKTKKALMWSYKEPPKILLSSLSAGLYCWACSLPLGVVCFPSSLGETKFSQLEIPSRLEIGAYVHFSIQV